MLSDDDLKRMARQSESELIEKKKSRPGAGEVRIALVAFANSVKPGEWGVIFIGIGPRGEIVGVHNADEDQREIRRIADHECYPPVGCSLRVIQIDDKEVVAVLIPNSSKTPHFVGHAYKRIGSESKRCSEQAMNELIASRNDKARVILARSDKVVMVELRPSKPLQDLRGEPRIELRRYKILSCDAHSVTIEDMERGRRISEPLSQVELIPIHINNCTLQLLIRDPDHSKYSRRPAT